MLEFLQEKGKKMNILIICNYSSGLYTFRGMLIQELIKQGHTVKAIVPKIDDENEKKAENNLKKMHCAIKRIPMERRGMNPVKDLGLMRAYYATVKKMQPDLKGSVYCEYYRTWNSISGKWNVKTACDRNVQDCIKKGKSRSF